MLFGSSRAAALLIACLLLMSHTSVHANIDCDQFVGTWHGERYEESLNANRVTLVTFFSDGSYAATFELLGENDRNVQRDSGRWSCSDDLLTIRLDNDTHVYRVISLDMHHAVFQVAQADCSLVVGDCEGVVYGLTRLSDEAAVLN